MRFVTYISSAGDDRVGIVDGDEVIGLEPGLDMVSLIENGDLLEQGHQLAQNPHETVSLAAVALRAPLQPRSIRDCAGFLQHLRNLADAVDLPVDDRHTQFPPFYFSNPDTRMGPHDPVPIAPNSERFDFELEIAAVIGRSGSNIAYSEAESHIAGYMLFCDWSARDLQVQEMPLRLGPAKGKDTANTIGPYLVTPDEIEPYRAQKAFDLRMTAHVNGNLVTDGRWNTIDWGFPDMIAYASRGTRLRAGDLIGSGTVETGCLFEHFVANTSRFQGWLMPGDLVELSVEHLGTLTHRITKADVIQPLSSGY